MMNKRLVVTVRQSVSQGKINQKGSTENHAMSHRTSIIDVL